MSYPGGQVGSHFCVCTRARLASPFAAAGSCYSLPLLPGIMLQRSSLTQLLATVCITMLRPLCQNGDYRSANIYHGRVHSTAFGAIPAVAVLLWVPVRGKHDV